MILIRCTKHFVNGLLKGSSFNDTLTVSDRNDPAYGQLLDCEKDGLTIRAFMGSSDYRVTDVKACEVAA